MSHLPLDDIAEFVTGFHLARVDAATVARAQMTMLDTVACMVAGSQNPVVRDIALATASGATASILGTPLKSSAAGAAFVNGVSAAWLGLDETHFKMRQHPAIHVIPAALAVAEQMNSSAEELLAAVVSGYEVGARFGRAAILRREVHSHGTHGLVGGVVAAAALMKLNTEGVKRGVRLAASTLTASASTARDEGADVFRTYSGLSSERAVTLAGLAAVGVDGAHEAAPRILGQVLGSSFDTASLSSGLGEDYVVGGNFIKEHSCCADLHASITAVSRAMDGRRIPPSEVASVRIVTHASACEVVDVHPESAVLASFSLPYVVGAYLVLGHCQNEAFSAISRSNPAIRGLAQRVRVEPGERESRAFPDRLQAEATISTTDGSSFRATVDLSHDSARWPNEHERVARKARGLLSLVLPEHRVAEIIDLSLRSNQRYPVRALISMISRSDGNGMASPQTLSRCSTRAQSDTTRSASQAARVPDLLEEP